MKANINNYTKQALWDVFGKKCFYCRMLLPFKNIHIDHVIPIKVFDKNQPTLRTKYKLSNDFEFNSLDNLVASCPSCNSSEKGSEEVENGIPIWLGKVKKKKKLVITAAENLKSVMSVGLPDEYKEFFISFPNFMPVDIKLDSVRKKDIDMLMKLTFSDKYSPLKLTSPEDRNIRVQIYNLSQFKYYTDKGYFGDTTSDMSFSSTCDCILIFLNQLKSAKSIEIKVGFDKYWEDIPVKILDPGITPEGNDEFSQYKTVGEVVDGEDNVTAMFQDGRLIITKHYPEYSEKEFFFIREILQADFTGENNKNEALLFTHYKSGGTLNFSYSNILKLSDCWHFHEESNDTRGDSNS